VPLLTSLASVSYDILTVSSDVNGRSTHLQYFLADRYIEHMQIDPRALRLSLGLTQRVFAERYRIPLRTVQRWEVEPERPINLYARLLLTLIQRDPERIARMLKDD